jgi:hypothetical protein
MIDRGQDLGVLGLGFAFRAETKQLLAFVVRRAAVDDAQCPEWV